MINELDLVVLTQDIPEQNLIAGDIGTVVLIHDQGAGYEVEFATLRGATLGVITVDHSFVRTIGTKEIAHVREVA